ncbi:hypothetical protein [Nocardia sp. IFM 10818]
MTESTQFDWDLPLPRRGGGLHRAFRRWKGCPPQEYRVRVSAVVPGAAARPAPVSTAA